MDGNTIYEEKHRRPKWVTKNELKQFQSTPEDILSFENSRNNRIKMEDPFSRMPKENKVFPHINSDDVSKFIVGQSYLAKRPIDKETTTGMHP